MSIPTTAAPSRGEPTVWPQLADLAVGAFTVAGGVIAGGLVGAPLIWDGTNRIVKNVTELAVAVAPGGTLEKQQQVSETFESATATELPYTVAAAIAREYRQPTLADSIETIALADDAASMQKGLDDLLDSAVRGDGKAVFIAVSSSVNDAAKVADNLPAPEVERELGKPGSGEVSSGTAGEELLSRFAEQIERQMRVDKEAERQRILDMQRALEGARKTEHLARQEEQTQTSSAAETS